MSSKNGLVPQTDQDMQAVNEITTQLPSAIDNADKTCALDRMSTSGNAKANLDTTFSSFFVDGGLGKLSNVDKFKDSELDVF